MGSIKDCLNTCGNFLITKYALFNYFPTRVVHLRLTRTGSMDQVFVLQKDLCCLDTCGKFLIPGLPNHIALLCLIKIPRLYHLSLSAVSWLWCNVFRSPGFYKCRREMGSTDPWLIVLSTEMIASMQRHYFAYDLRSRQLLFKAQLPSLGPAETRGVDNYKLAAMNEYLVVLTWKPDGIRHQRSPFLLYNTVTNTWKRGSIPSVRCHFVCGVIRDNLYVTGGFNVDHELERSTEAYNFKSDQWKTVADLPQEVNNIEDNVVFQNKLYLRCHSSSDHRKVFWAYDPRTDTWSQEPRLSSSSELSVDQLVATDSCIYALSMEDAFCRFERGQGEWKIAAHMWEAADTSFSTRAARVFSHGNDIFVLTGSHARWHSTLLSEDGCKCYQLFLGRSCYRSGAIVQT